MIIMRFILKIILLGTFLTGCALLILGNPFGVPIIFLILLFIIISVGIFRSRNRSDYYHQSDNNIKSRSYSNSRKMWPGRWRNDPPSEAQKRLARDIGYKDGGTKGDYFRGIRDALRRRK